MSATEAPVTPPTWSAPATAPSSRGAMDPRRKSPVLAGLLSLVPGLGQVYLGYYARGFVHAITIGSLITMLASDFIGPQATPLFSLFMVFFWLYNIIDAARRAALINLTLDGLGSMELPSETLLPPFHGSIGAGLGLIVLGAIFLSNTLFDVPLDWLEDWWPAAPLAVGIYLLGRGILERQKAAVRASSRD